MRSKQLSNRAFALAVAAALSLPAGPSLAGGGCPQCATEPTQIMNNIQLVAQYMKQVEQHSTQVRNMVTNVSQLQDMLVQATQFDMMGQLKPFYDIAGSLRSIGMAVQSAKGIAYSMDNLDGRFRAQFKGYVANPNVSYQYRAWSDNVNSTFESTMKGMELTRQEIENETTFAQKLQAMAATSRGRNQLEQTIIAFADASVGQMQKLRTLMLMDMQSKQAYQSYNVNKELLSRANTEESLKGPTTSQSKTTVTAGGNLK